jgi:hypothetical protein
LFWFGFQDTDGIAEKVRKGVIRYAPSFIAGVYASIGDAHPYTIEAMANFLRGSRPVT